MPPSLQVILVGEDDTVKTALKRLDRAAVKVLLVVDESRRLLGTVTDGDIRRHLLASGDLEDSIAALYNRAPHSLSAGDASLERAGALMLEMRIELLPILDEGRRVVDFITWSQAFSASRTAFPRPTRLDVPVVIMAGGRGTRLDPFTKVFPKPLIPFGDKPILEVVIDEFRAFGVDRFYVTLNYKAEMVELYFQGGDRDYDIEFIREEEYLGTAGSLRLLRGKIEGPFVVCNCDTVVKTNFVDVVDHHRQENAVLTILSSIRHYVIPYGVIEYGCRGEVQAMREKPEQTFTVNTGCYVVDSQCLDWIPDRPYHMTDLINDLVDRRCWTITYPVNESDYVDVGEWEEYRRSLKHFQLP